MYWTFDSSTYVSIRINSLRLKVFKVKTTPLQRYWDENILISGKNSVPLSRFYLDHSTKENNFLYQKSKNLNKIIFP